MKNCPFCGAKEPVLSEHMASNGEPRYVIRCRSCACEGGGGKTPTAAEGWWNMRENIQASQTPAIAKKDD